MSECAGKPRGHGRRWHSQVASAECLAAVKNGAVVGRLQLLGDLQERLGAHRTSWSRERWRPGCGANSAEAAVGPGVAAPALSCSACRGRAHGTLVVFVRRQLPLPSPAPSSTSQGQHVAGGLPLGTWKWPAWMVALAAGLYPSAKNKLGRGIEMRSIYRYRSLF